ncbi:GntR family transcriptional regulator [Pseudomonas sp. Marseille-QA0332]
MKKYSRHSTASQVADHLREAIVFGDLMMGTPLSEAQLADQLGVSRTPVREALRELAQEGLVKLRPYLGASVFVLSSHELSDMLAFRELLEMQAMRLAIRQNPGGLVKDMRSVVNRMNDAVNLGDAKHYLALDTEFHDVIIDTSGSAYIRDAYALIGSKLSVLRTFIPKDPKRLQHSLDSHREMLELLASNQSEIALERLRGHLSNAAKAFSADSALLIHNLGDIMGTETIKQV